MTRIRRRSEAIRAYILEHIGEEGIAGKVSQEFSISRQAANRHLKSLSCEGSLVSDGQTRKRSYKIAALAAVSFLYDIKPGLAEDVVWREDVQPFLGALPENVLELWNYAFTEMFNNAIDHSGGKSIYVSIAKSAVDTQLTVMDDGVGIFKKIQAALGLLDEKQAIFELSKGKLTTDAANHSGQGIFFTSRMVNGFDILSGGVFFSHELGKEVDVMFDDQYSVGGSYGFNKTIVPVKLAKYGTDQLVSRSQAKRVLVRVEQFSQVIFDFTGVDRIGQAFADQIFRVFATEHPEVDLIPSHANRDIMGLIQATIKAGRPGFKGTLPSDA